MRKKGKYERIPEPAPVSTGFEKMKKRTLLQSYILSLISMCLCSAMLLGTTMAWFTDDVVSSDNQIYVGNLEVDLELQEGERWVSLKNVATKIFDDSFKWEPNYTAYEVLRVTNDGDLAFDYRLTILAKNVVTYTDLDTQKTYSEETIWKAYESFDVYVCMIDKEENYTKPASFTEITAEGSTWVEVGENLADVIINEIPIFENRMDSKDDQGNWADPVDTYAVAIHMSDSASDDVMGVKLLFDVKLVASQKSAESDAFGPGYDALPEDYTIGDVPVKLTPTSYENIIYHDKEGYTDKVKSIEIYSKQDLVSALELWNEGMIVHNGANDISAELIFKSNIDFGGDEFTGFGKGVNVTGNGYTLTNVQFIADESGKAGFIPYAGNNIITGLTIKDATVKGAQAGVFAGNAANVTLTNCALAGDIIVIYEDSTAESYNGVGAVIGVISEMTSTIDVDVTNAKITLVTDGITYEADKNAEDNKLVGVVYDGSYTIGSSGSTTE